MSTVLTQNVLALAGTGSIGQMVKDLNTALVQGPIAGGGAVLDFITSYAKTCDEILSKWRTDNDDPAFGATEMANILQKMQDRWLGLVAQRQRITAEIAVKSTRTQAESLAATLGLSYSTGFSANVGADYERSTSTGNEVAAHYTYEAESIAPDGSEWSAIVGTLDGAPADLAGLLKAALNEQIEKVLSTEE